jgi:small-conductance mechanosensitive channel
LVAVPVVLVLASAAGYHYTATVIQTRRFISGLVVLLVLTAFGLFTHWLRIARRRMAVRQARQRLATPLRDQ